MGGNNDDTSADVQVTAKKNARLEGSASRAEYRGIRKEQDELKLDF